VGKGIVCWPRLRLRQETWKTWYIQDSGGRSRWYAPQQSALSPEMVHRNKAIALNTFTKTKFSGDMVVTSSKPNPLD